MIRVHHVNCGTLFVPQYPTIPCHCLLLEDDRRLALIDTGIGLLDVRNPVGRLGQPLIDAAGFQFHEHDTAVRRVESLGFRAADVRHVVLRTPIPTTRADWPTSPTPKSTSRRRNTPTSRAVTGGTSPPSSATVLAGRSIRPRIAGGSGWRRVRSNWGSRPRCC